MDDLELLEELCDTVKEHQPVRARADSAQSGAEHAALLPQRVHRAHRAQALPGRRVHHGSPGPLNPPWRCLHERHAVTSKHSVIDGKEVSARADETILEVARENDIDIPTLCHLDGLSRRGRVPHVPGGDQGLNKLLPACVATRRRRHGSQHQLPSACNEYRRNILETAVRRAQPHLLGLRGQRSLRTAVAGAGAWALTHVRFPYRNPELQVDASHERFAIDHNRCILCTRCVRVCDEIEGAHIWDVMGRGIDSMIIADLHAAVGRIVDVHPLRQMRAGVPDRRAVRQEQDRSPRCPSTRIFCRT